VTAIKKKLLWAVSQALQQRKIGINHPDFKKYVSVLAKIIKRLFLEFHINSNSTSETLLKLSTKYVYSVLNGKTSEEIYLLEKKNFEKEKKISNVFLLDSLAPNLTFIPTASNSKTYKDLTKHVQTNEFIKFKESSSDGHIDYSSIQLNKSIKKKYK